MILKEFKAYYYLPNGAYEPLDLDNSETIQETLVCTADSQDKAVLIITALNMLAINNY